MNNDSTTETEDNDDVDIQNNTIDDISFKLDDIVAELKKSNRQNNIYQAAMFLLVLPITITILFIWLTGAGILSSLTDISGANQSNNSSSYNSMQGL